MEKELVNQEYLKELLGVARDQDEDDLVGQMYGRLVQSRDQFLDDSTGMIDSDHKKLQFELHKLKNQFANLGCEAVSQLLERMYQLARKEETSEVQKLMIDFQQLSDVTLKQLQNEISH